MEVESKGVKTKNQIVLIMNDFLSGLMNSLSSPLLRDKIKVLSTGDLFRKELCSESELRSEIEGCLSKGRLIPNELVTKLINAEISILEKDKIIVLINFPKRIDQFYALQRNVLGEVKGLIYFSLPEKEILRRDEMIRLKTRGIKSTKYVNRIIAQKKMNEVMFDQIPEDFQKIEIDAIKANEKELDDAIKKIVF